MAQQAQPISDLDNTGGWTSTPLWSKIDEGGGGDGTTILSDTTPVASEPFTVDLSTITDPAKSTGHFLKIRWAKNAGGGGFKEIQIELRQGYTNEGSQGTLIATDNYTINSTTLNTDQTELSTSETDAITDYTDLQIRVHGVSGNRALKIDFVELEIVDELIIEQAGWRWFEDGTGGLTALAAEEIKPTLPGNENYGVIRIRVELTESGGLTDTNKIAKMQYSGDDGTTWVDMFLDDGNNDDEHLVVADGADVAGNTITSRLLANTDQSGKYHETQVLVETLNGNASLEVDFAMWTRCVVPDRNYRFRMFWDGTAVPIKSGSVKIELGGSTAATRQYTDGVLNSVTALNDDGTGGVPNSNAWGHGHRGFYDGARWWVFYNDASNTLMSYKSTASLTSGGWGSALTRSFTNIDNPEDWNVVFKEIGGTKYVLLVVGDSTTQRYFRRGTISGSTITWDTTERTYTNPHNDVNNGACPVAIDDGDFLWFGGKGTTGSNEIWAQRSVNVLSNATYHTFNTAHSASELSIVGAAPYDEVELVGLASSEILVVYYDNGNTNLRARKCTESGGMGSPVTINTSVNAADSDWAVIRDVDGNEVYCLYGNENTNVYDILLHVYNVSGDSWAAGTNPSIDKTGDGTAADGIVAHWGDDGLLRVYYTITDTSSRDTRIRTKDYSGGTGGTWSGTSEISPSEIGNADPTGVVRDGANAIILIERGDINVSIGADYALEYYVEVTAAPGGATVYPPFPRQQRRAVRM